MSTKKQGGSLAAIVGQLGWSVLVGLALTVIFYLLLLRGPLSNEMAIRYFASHPVSYCATAMFFVGLVALGSKLRQTVRQFALLSRTSLGLAEGETIDVSQVGSLLDRLSQLPAAARESYLGRRLRRALKYVANHGSADGLDDELKYLADMDSAHQHDSYSLVRILIWATPMLGFLGTVIGITQALGDLDPSELANNVQSAMDKLLSGLYVAFDTTALALTLSIVLMFMQFIVDRIETELLQAVDGRVSDELAGRFAREARTSDPHLASVERMATAVIRAADVLVQKQVQLWKESLEEMRSAWRTWHDAQAETMAEGIEQAMRRSLDHFTEQFSSRQSELLDSTQAVSADLHREICDTHEHLRSQTDLMQQQLSAVQQLVVATADVRRLESALNENLNALAAAGQFEQAVMSLGATAQLLAARIGGMPASRVDLSAEANQERAA